ncbi:DNA-deoxyinosine glycosylase [Chitinimonas sp. BJB300]|uniref:DNA-deoxyinosine glycosylase n=1 Tax=Chitinimonas sp. BJB300 TaxID=1559339 RepID=UPI000C0FBF57|nr:DNA-deoxyinosine glycosylase [Chitinimonas sp. BJB300]PHV11446.1 DNA-deoxyinosine glycosylase [Chitinimonas sp. BJB300]TSJ87227.1 DNA-deoxyinosine glycosylase [Chitinimonas sp. BJB300]
MTERKRCFPPVVDAHTRVLLLGSLPGEASLKANRYYAHPQNRCWHLLGEVLGIPLVDQTYIDRLAALLRHGVGLWDVIAEADRPGSLDAAIRNQAHNDLHQLVNQLPNLHTIAFNGGTAARLGRRQLADLTKPLQLLDLPSSSPAYTLPYAEKLTRWQMLVSQIGEA